MITDQKRTIEDNKLISDSKLREIEDEVRREYVRSLDGNKRSLVEENILAEGAKG